MSGCVVEFANGVVAWDSQAQPFISQSTAEAEVISYNQAFQIGEGVSSLLQELGFRTSKQLYGDSKSGIAVIASECGPWRTRHLRLRSSKLRELVQDPDQPWTIRHLPGQLLVADGLAKGLVYQSFEKFKDQLRMQPMWEAELPSMNKVEKKDEESNKVLAKILGVAGAVLCGCNIVPIGVLLVLVALVVGMTQNKGQDRSLQHEEDPVAQGDEKPRVKAFRVLRSDGGQEQESSHSGNGRGARARGRDAMALHDLTQSLGGLNITTAVTVNVDLRGSGEEAARLRASTMSGEEAARLRASTTSGEEAARLRASTTRGEEAARLRASTTRGEEAERLRASSTSGGYGGERMTAPLDQVWNQARFQQAPRGADQWQVDLIPQGWLVRIHGSKGRVRPFHPLHRSCPLPAHELHGDRISVVFDATGGYEAWRYQHGVWVYLLRLGCLLHARNGQGFILDARNAFECFFHDLRHLIDLRD